MSGHLLHTRHREQKNLLWGTIVVLLLASIGAVGLTQLDKLHSAFLQRLLASDDMNSSVTPAQPGGGTSNKRLHAFSGGWIDRGSLRIIPDEAGTASVRVTPVAYSIDADLLPLVSDSLPFATDGGGWFSQWGDGIDFGLPTTPNLIDVAPYFTLPTLGVSRITGKQVKLDRALTIYRFEPPMPPQRALKAGILKGTASVQLTLDSTGQLNDVTILSESPEGYHLGSALSDALYECYYEAPIVHGREVGATIVVSYEFAPNTPMRVSTSTDGIEIVLR